MDQNQEETRTDRPWVGADIGGNGQQILKGNRSGLTLLKGGIERALASDADAAIFEENHFVFSHVMVVADDPRVNFKSGPNRKAEAKDALALLVTALIALPILMVFVAGLIFIWKLFHGTVQ